MILWLWSILVLLAYTINWVTCSNDPSSSHLPGYISFIILASTVPLAKEAEYVSLCHEIWFIHRISWNFMSLLQKSLLYSIHSLVSFILERSKPQISYWSMSVSKRVNVEQDCLSLSTDLEREWQNCFKWPEIRSVRPRVELCVSNCKNCFRTLLSSTVAVRTVVVLPWED